MPESFGRLADWRSTAHMSPYAGSLQGARAMHDRLWVAGAAMLGLAGCAPSLALRPLQLSDEPTLVSPSDHQLPFALVASDLFIAPMGMKLPTDDADAIKPLAACPAAPLGPAPSPTATDLLSAPPEANWRACVEIARITPVPIRGPLYLAIAQANTSISALRMDHDPLLLKTVTFGKVRSTAETITAMGTDAVAWISLGLGGGVIGAVVAGGLDEATGLYSEALWLGPSPVTMRYLHLIAPFGRPLQDDPRWANPGRNLRESGRVCSGVEKTYDLTGYGYSMRPTASLSLPITVSFDIQDSDAKACWTPLPRLAGDAADHAPAWFYRVQTSTPSGRPDEHVDTLELPPAMRTTIDPAFAKVIKPADLSEDGRNSVPDEFPVSACRWVEVELTYWQELDKPIAPDTVINTVQRRLIVADPRFVQVVKIHNQKSEVINVNPICGAYVTSAPVAAPSTNPLSAVIQAAAAVKKAEPTKGK
jgi:hypothetical protein